MAKFKVDRGEKTEEPTLVRIEDRHDGGVILIARKGNAWQHILIVTNDGTVKLSELNNEHALSLGLQIAPSGFGHTVVRVVML